ncbi:hypothetical protein BQ8420_28615 [Nocardiopsis sp. JB363]|nr:hypothetical protein BQ8420_28615 [Nocardiopsis sp. JB363]
MGLHSTVLERPEGGEEWKNLAGEARQWAHRRAQDLGYDPIRDDTLLYHLSQLVSELVTNALVHARGAVMIALARERCSALRLEVYDHSPKDGSEPHVEVHSALEAAMRTHGRGLLLVRKMSTGWGALFHGTGHLVWAYPTPTDPGEVP